jgi:hypothetical protein
MGNPLTFPRIEYNPLHFKTIQIMDGKYIITCPCVKIVLYKSNDTGNTQKT